MPSSRFSLPLLAVFLMAGPTMAQSTLPTCGTFPNGVERYACRCDAGFFGGSIWGTGIYTTDSDICVAAQHAGVITSAGGDVLAEAGGPQEDYPASEQNGISSLHWGAYEKSFRFATEGAVSIQAAPTSEAPACTTLQADQDRITCSCAAGTGRAGSVWGSGPYTADSSICAAATHAGVISANGGEVTAIRSLGVPQYSGSTANGITSANWESFVTSLSFDRN